MKLAEAKRCTLFFMPLPSLFTPREYSLPDCFWVNGWKGSGSPTMTVRSTGQQAQKVPFDPGKDKQFNRGALAAQ
jgi:hypothetical protein